MVNKKRRARRCRQDSSRRGRGTIDITIRDETGRDRTDQTLAAALGVAADTSVEPVTLTSGTVGSVRRSFGDVGTRQGIDRTRLIGVAKMRAREQALAAVG